MRRLRMPIIQARGLAIAYGGRTVLECVDLTVNRGEFWFLLGGNGTGKTSFIRAVLGLVRPSAGELRRDPVEASRDRIGFVPQRCDLNATLRTTVREFVSLGLVGTSGARGSERGARLASALARVGLDGRATADYQSLSGGMRQRASIARALVRQPRLLILDEPTAGLDVAAEQAILSLVAGLNRDQGLTALIVTHDLQIAAHYASHVALFHGGGVISGLRQEVLSSQSLARIYGLSLDDADAGKIGGLTGRT
jgi:ABC-type Mn2+/Zn2+ transport system ATPase subunit